MISGILNKIKTGAEKLDHSITGHPWKSWRSIPRVMYWLPKYLIYRPARLTIKGFPYVVNLEQTWKQNIRPKIPFGNPDVYFDVKENKTTNKDYGIRFDPIMKKKGHDEDVRMKVPKYKLLQRSMQQFEAWLESSEEDRKNKNFIPKSSDKKELSADEKKVYDQLIELHKFLKERNGTVKVEGGALIIRIDVTNKTLEEIEEQIVHCCTSLGMPHDTKMIKTIANRLYKKTQDREISSDEPFAKQQLKSTSTSPSHSVSKDKCANIDEETGEIIEVYAIQQGSNLSDTKNKESEKQIPNIEMKMQNSIHGSNLSQNKEKEVDGETGETIKGEDIVLKERQMSDNVNDSQFSLTVFPTNVVNLQSKKGPNELQSDLVSSCQFSEIERSNMSDIKNKIIEVAGKDLGDVSLSTTNIKSSYISGSRRGEELSKGRSQG
ncbi:MAG: hypothetical protein U0X86_000301 [Wolbachia endosymbiont of Xenopsylla cheopis]